MLEFGGDGEQRGIGGFEEFGDFLGQIDSDRAPGDASTATDASAGIELIVPGGEFVSKPLAVTGLDRVSDRGARGVGKVGVEARVPATFSNRRVV